MMATLPDRGTEKIIITVQGVLLHNSRSVLLLMHSIYPTAHSKLFPLLRSIALVVVFANPIMAAPFTRPVDDADGTDRILTIGKVSSNPARHYNRLRPIVEYVAARMKDLGIVGADVELAKDNEQMIEYLKEGKVDWVTETVYSALYYQLAADTRILLKRWKKGNPEYHTVFFTRKDSSIERLEYLKSRQLALEDKGSTTGFFLPLMELQSAGIGFYDADENADGSLAQVGYRLVKSEINMVTWVHRGLSSAGAFSNQDWEASDHTPKNIRRDLKLFHRTRSVPRALELVRADLETPIERRLIELLLHAHEDPEGRRAMRAYYKTTRFEELDQPTRLALDKLLSRVRTFTGFFSE
jgi:ABC-type phosphate/phosphonate transport system substrate-binding protein